MPAMTSTSRRRARTRLLVALAAGFVAFAAIVGGAFLLLGQSGGDSPPSPAPVAQSSSAAEPEPTEAEDPYEVYLKNRPKGSPKLSREDAQARAYLGCGQEWAPGTVDAVLAEAYADLCEDR